MSNQKRTVVPNSIGNPALSRALHILYFIFPLSKQILLMFLWEAIP